METLAGEASTCIQKDTCASRGGQAVVREWLDDDEVVIRKHPVN